MSVQMSDAELRERLLQDSEEYRRLAAEHQHFDHVLEDFANKHYLSEEEQLQEKTMKKKKLMLKDQMYAMVQKKRRELEPE